MPLHGFHDTLVVHFRLAFFIVDHDISGGLALHLCIGTTCSEDKPELKDMVGTATE